MRTNLHFVLTPTLSMVNASREPRTASCINPFGNIIHVRVEQIRIHIQRHGRRRVPEHVLNHLHRGAGIDLWSYVDGIGVGQDRVSTICADLFADDLSRDPRETLVRVSEGLQRLSEAGRIVRYTVENRDYLAIDNWSKH